MRNAPAIRVVLGAGAHSAVKSALAVIGIGEDECEIVPVDSQGRIIPDEIPELDDHTLLILQASNVNGGAYEPWTRRCFGDSNQCLFSCHNKRGY